MPAILRSVDVITDFAGIPLKQAWVPKPRKAPESPAFHYRDTGCEVWHTCLECPLSQCVEEWRYRMKGGGLKLSYRVAIWQFKDCTAKAIWEHFGISRRQAYRWKARLERTASYEEFLRDQSGVR